MLLSKDTKETERLLRYRIVSALTCAIPCLPNDLTEYAVLTQKGKIIMGYEKAKNEQTKPYTASSSRLNAESDKIGSGSTKYYTTPAIVNGVRQSYVRARFDEKGRRGPNRGKNRGEEDEDEGEEEE